MTYSDKYKFIFLAIPKAASGTIQNYLQNYGVRSKARWDQNHAWATRVQETLGMERWNNYFKFAFVRNPWDRAVSLYYWKKRTGSHSYEHFHMWSEKTGHDTLYHKFLLDENGNQCVDFIGRFENLLEDFQTVCKKIGIPPPEKIGHENIQNVPNRKHYTQYFTNEGQIQRVRDLYHRTIDILGYEFGK